MTTVAVATYNMSFVSDAGLNPDKMGPGGGNYASEAAFLKSNKSGNPRQFWLNALATVKKFWDEVPNAGVMGFQELNKTAEGSGTGSDALAAFAKEKGLAFAVDEVVVNPTMKPAIGVMWNTKYFGEYKSHMIKDLTHPLTEVGKPGQSGRPILVLQTTKDFVFVVLHGPNSEDASKKTQKDLKDAIKSTVETAAPDAKPEKIFIMGDFNDRFDAITSLDVAGGTLTYTGKAPLSCCHNWDSSCKAITVENGGRYKSLDTELKRKTVGTCIVENYPSGFINVTGSNTKKWKDKNAEGKEIDVEAKWSTFARQLAGPGPRIEMGDEGNIENYRYYGDKVFGLNPVSNIQMFPPGRTGPSTESDHEMVMAEFEIPVVAGGRRRKSKKVTRKRSSHSGKAKKSSRKAKKSTRKH